MTNHWSDDHCRWLKQRFPELESTPIYVRRVSECPGLSTCGGALAFMSNALDVEMQASLEAHDQWEGRGIPIAIQDSEAFNRLSWHRQLAILIHELSHWLDGANSSLRKPTNEWTLLDQMVATPKLIDKLIEAYQIKIDPQQERCLHHGKTFVRAGLHCWWRCRREISLNDACVLHPSYHSPDVADAVEALRPELEAGGDITAIMRELMPEKFVNLWPSL